MSCFFTSTILSALALLASAAPTFAQAFAAVSTYVVGPVTNPSDVAVADLNGDGQLDVVTANFIGSVTVLLGRTDGTLQYLARYSTEVGNPTVYRTTPYGVTVADVDGDNRLDLLTANFGSESIGIMLGNGNGTFQPITHTRTGANTRPTKVAVADVTSDGQPDLLIADYRGGEILLHPSSGTGYRYQVGATTTGPVGLVVADVNNDGQLDMLTPNYTSNTVGVLLGVKAGVFQPVTTYPTGSEVVAVAVADINSDGKPDLLVALSTASAVGVLLGTGTGSFQPMVTYSTGVDTVPASLVAADLNGDGKLDIATANSWNSTVGVLPGNGNGTFQAATAYALGSRMSPSCIVVADLNGDRKPDLLTANSNDNSVSVLLNATALATRAALPGARVSLAPNPTIAAATLSLAGLPATVAQVQATLLDATGRAVGWHTLAAAQGSARAEVPTAMLAAGLYLVQLVALDAQREVVGSLPVQRLSVR